MVDCHVLCLSRSTTAFKSLCQDATIQKFSCNDINKSEIICLNSLKALFQTKKWHYLKQSQSHTLGWNPHREKQYSTRVPMCISACLRVSCLVPLQGANNDLLVLLVYIYISAGSWQKGIWTTMANALAPRGFQPVN
jgi:hypothetical protein